MPTPPSAGPGSGGIEPDLHTGHIPSGEVRYLRTGQGAPLVLLYPFRAQLEYFIPLSKELDTTRFGVIVPDLPGHGHSGATRADYTAACFIVRGA